MSNDVSPEAMQQRIQTARREAETLKDRIKRKKDDLQDGSRKSQPSLELVIITKSPKWLCFQRHANYLQSLRSPRVNKKHCQETK